MGPGDDEVFVLIIGGIVGAVAWWSWYAGLAGVSALASSRLDRWPLYATPVFCAVLTGAVLRTLASHDVRSAPFYLLQYQCMGAAWVGIAARLFGYFGVSARDDVVERRNRAAGYAVSGGLVGATLCFAGGNIGDGPGWWVVVFSAFLSTGTLFALWALLEKLAAVSESVTVERDLAAGIRLGAWLAASGLILGRAVAGDWEGSPEAVADFAARGWPALALTAAAAVAELLLRPRQDRPRPGFLVCGVLPALLFLGGAAVYVASDWRTW